MKQTTCPYCGQKVGVSLVKNRHACFEGKQKIEKERRIDIRLPSSTITTWSTHICAISPRLKKQLAARLK